MARVSADRVELQLAEARDVAFTDAAWLFELKLDGFRLLAERVNGKVRLLFRRGRDATNYFPEVVAALGAVPGGDLLLDGELVIQDPAGRPIFQRLLKRSSLVDEREIRKSAAEAPAVFFAFDLLSQDDADLRALPLLERKARLKTVLTGATGRVRELEWIDTQGSALLEAVKEQGLEGVVAKKKASPYEGGRTPAWLKVALQTSGDFAIVGYAAEWGALHLATWNGHEFVYAGKVGAGFSPKRADEVREVLSGLVLKRPPCAGTLPADRDVVWVQPRLVAEIRFKHWPVDMLPREPVFLRVREDKTPEECQSPEWQRPKKPLAKTTLKNASKVFFPDDGITKAEVLEYYRQVAPVLLKYLKDRPFLMVRYPDGIAGKSFFQKAISPGAPVGTRTIRQHNPEDGKDHDQIVCDTWETLEWAVSQAGLTFHIPSERVGAPGRADWAVIDFDPKGAPFEQVVRLALSLHDICGELGLTDAIKTSGSSGLHVMLALHQQVDDQGAQSLAQLLAVALNALHPDISTTERVMERRKGRVYIDALQNYGGKTIAAPYTVRALPTAPISMPIPWSLVGELTSPRQFTVKNGPEYLEKHGDALASVFLSEPPDLAGVMTRLAALVSSRG